MKIRDLVERLEQIEDSLRKQKDYDTEQEVGKLIEDIIEHDLQAEKQIRNEIAKFIDKTIEERVVEEAMYSGSIAQA
tara:strand:- start:351 stop:581 length:231 start_codon:yes stop_codon:yes gene_type:complete